MVNFSAKQDLNSDELFSRIANISHDIRTPLHTMLGTAELLKIKPHLPEQAQHLEAIITSGKTLLQLIEKMLGVSIPAPEKVLHVQPIKSAPRQKLSVLLVEDIPLIQKFSIDMLETLGCDVTIANNATQAIEFSQKPFDLILMDIGLPDENGLQVIRVFRESLLHKKTPIIALTAHATTQVRRDCLAAGVNEFVAKPASYHVLSYCVRRWAPSSSAALLR